MFITSSTDFTNPIITDGVDVYLEQEKIAHLINIVLLGVVALIYTCKLYVEPVLMLRNHNISMSCWTGNTLRALSRPSRFITAVGHVADTDSLAPPGEGGQAPVEVTYELNHY